MNDKTKTEEDGAHKPVLLEEVVQAFNLVAPLHYQAHKNTKPIIVDATLGAGGHALELIKRGAYVVGIDADERMVEIAGNNLKKALRVGRPFSEPRNSLNRRSESETCPAGNCDSFFTIVNDNFINIDSILKELKIGSVNGILFDLGISSHHYAFNRGFSFQNADSPLDMRLSSKQQVKASDLINALSKGQLMQMFCEVMPFNESRKLVFAILNYRKAKTVKTTEEFLTILDSVYGENHGSRRISKYTLPFMAVRIAVNSELDNLKIALEKAWQVLNNGGAMAVISFHSGEDRIVKEYFRSKEKDGKARVEKSVITPSASELKNNPRSRSAKLRIIRKT